MLTLSFPTLSCLVVTAYFINAYMQSQRSPLNRVPSIGPSGFITSYVGFIKSLFYSREMLKEGYEKYYGRTFKIAMPTHWLVLVTGPKLIDELRRAPEDHLSSIDAIAESFQIDFTIGKESRENDYHVASIQTMTRNLAAVFPDMYDEVVSTFSEIVPAKEDEWLSVPAYKTMTQAVCRGNNRIFVGLPLCRDSQYLDLNINFPSVVLKAANILAHIPVFLRPLVSKTIGSAKSSKGLMIRLLGPMIQERLDKIERYGGLKYPDRPNDLITFLLENSKPHQRSVQDIAVRILFINLVSTHATVMATTHILFDLASRPAYAEPLRQEIISVLQDEGWSKDAIGKMHKVDSFVHESQRLAGLTMISMVRRAVKDFTFSDGTIIPAGQYVGIPASALHVDQDSYPDPDEFDGFRFSRLRERDSESLKYQAVSPSLDYITFGGGRHTCPGRFFAVTLMKTILSYVVLNYDVKLVGGIHPKTQTLGVLVKPDLKAHVLFRKRHVTI